MLPCCCDPLINKSHWASSFFHLHSKHSSVSTATHYTEILGKLRMDSSPKHVVLLPQVVWVLCLLSKVPSMYLRPTSPVFLRTAHDLLFHITNSLLVLQPSVCNLTVRQQGSCFSGTVFQFINLYGGSWLPSDTPTNRLTTLYYLMI